MKIILLAFANDPDDPLDQLRREDREIYEILANRQRDQHFIVVRESFATIRSLTNFISMYRDQLILFHYGGHANQEMLQLDGRAAQAVGLADLLGQCPQLQAVVLNGCSTAGQVRLLRERGIPTVIATSAPVDDTIACDFGIRLYGELVNQNSLEKAFDAALGYVKTQRGEINVHRGFGTEREAQLAEVDAAEPVWVFFSDPTHKDWCLPTLTIRQEHPDFVPNVLLIEVLHESFKSEEPYQYSLVFYQKRMRGKLSTKVKEIALLDALPIPLSIQFRKLFASDQVKNFYVDATNSYNKLGRDRLYQMTAIYRLLLELLLSIMLSQIWEELRPPPSGKKSKPVAENAPPPFTVSGEVVRLVRACFRARDAAARDAFDAIHLVMAIRENFDRFGIDYFIPELKDLSDALAAQRELGQATLFFQSLSQRFAYDELAQEAAEAEALCILAETHLAEIGRHISFICRYNFASIKAIDLLKFRHQEAVRYQHSAIELMQGVGSEKKALEHINPTDTISVVLMRWTGEHWDHLNLSPFIIDENAHNRDATRAKLRYLLRYDPYADGYSYRHIDKLLASDPPLLIKKEEEYSIVREQIDAFLALLDKHQEAGPA